MPLATRTLPDGRPISRLGFGASSFWAKAQFPEEDAITAAVRARELGISYFDTGPSYAAGRAEQRLGKAIARFDGMPFIVSSKFGTHIANGKPYKDFSADRVRDTVHGSLRRLGVDRLDFLLLHGPQIADLTDELLSAIDVLKDDGDIVWSGVNSHDHRVVAATLDKPFDAIMLQYNVVDQSAKPLGEALAAKGRIVLGATTLAQGIFRQANFLPTSMKSAWYLARMLKNDPGFLWRSSWLKRASASVGLEPVEAAIGFVLREPWLTSGVFGSTRLANIEKNVRAAQRDYSAIDFTALMRR